MLDSNDTSSYEFIIRNVKSFNKEAEDVTYICQKRSYLSGYL